MKVADEVVAVPVPTGRSAARALLALWRVEGRRVLFHPTFLLGWALSATFFVVASTTDGNDAGLVYTLFTQWGLVPAAAGTFIAANLCALRSRRHRTDELFAAAPLSVAARTVASLLAVAWAVGACVVLLGGSVLLLQLWNGAAVAFPEGVRYLTPSPIEVVQGPAVVAVFGAFGVLVARWIPTRAMAPLAIIAMFTQMLGVSWSLAWPARWFHPIAWHQLPGRWVDTGPNEGYQIFEGFHVAALGWHVLYLVGVVVVLGALAVRRHGPHAGARAALIAGLAVAAAGGTLQTLVN